MRIDSDLYDTLLVSSSPNKEKNEKTKKYYNHEENYKENDSSPSPLAEKYQISAIKSNTPEEFMNSLLLDTRKEKIRIEKDMNYLYETFKECGFLIDYQEGFIVKIDKSLKDAEDNSKNLVTALKKSNDSMSCKQ